ncbi:MAG: hypothetical protein DMG16_21965 [Acidobacteria bacterium]|nr:MAG: hypothetical protein DMG16_21965 [Acidobacteriota bacterium]
MDLLIYGPAIFAGIIGSRYLSRLANFCLMVAVFQLDLAILLGQLRAAVFTPYTIICIIPALAGLVGDRYLSKCKYDLQIGSRYFLIGKLANALLIAGVSYVGGVLLAFHNRGKFIPLLFLQAIFVSAGSLVPPLVFILVALVAYRLRRFASP